MTLWRRSAIRSLTTTTSTSSACVRATGTKTLTSTSYFKAAVASPSLLSRSLSTAAATTPYQVTEFPSLIIGKDSVTPYGGSFAEVTATYLQPDPDAVQELVTALQQSNAGIVAHYYMDVELQGILTAVAQQLPGRVGIADSLKMGDMAVEMASASSTSSPIESVLCLGVDFMAESVQAILQRNGYPHIPVYRADARKIGCSLAESAEHETYRAWLQQYGSSSNAASSQDPALHVVYINTSLETKAVSSATVPTITCTSSNVLPTILQASAQMGPDLRILYGPDTYMGRNLERLLDVVSSSWTDAQIQAELHPQHTRASLEQLRRNMDVFPSGNCVVHHMFGQAVVDTVRTSYDDCFVTAHLEVPGEMFDIAMTKSLDDQGVVGSTSNILQFIARKVQQVASNSGNTATNGSGPQRLRFILGTEAGMVTSIVQAVQRILRDTGVDNLEAEIIFPVASEAVAAGDDESLAVVPGVQAGEGCSTAGGCATCPFMKMNHIDAVMDVLTLVQQSKESETAKTKLARHLPPARLQGKQINGRDAMDLGVEAILYMRQFMKDNAIPDELCQKVMQGQQTRELLYRS